MLLGDLNIDLCGVTNSQLDLLHGIQKAEDGQKASIISTISALGLEDRDMDMGTTEAMKVNALCATRSQTTQYSDTVLVGYQVVLHTIILFTWIYQREESTSTRRGYGGCHGGHVSVLIQ